MARWNRTAILTVSALTVLGLAACGPQDGSTDAKKEPTALELMAGDAKGSIQKASEAVGKATSVTFTMDGKTEGEPMKGTGFATLGTDRRAEMTVEDPKEGPTTVRVIGTAIYIGVPPAQQAEFDGKKWMKMDLAAAGAAGTEAMARMMEDVDPVESVKRLLAADTVTVVGEEAVAGTQTVHYAVVMPLATYLPTFTDAKLREAMEKEFTKLGIKEVKTDLWVDETYQLRRVRAYLNDANDVTIDYTDYGKAVTVEAPPAAETADLAKMLEGLTDSLKDLQG